MGTNVNGKVTHRVAECESIQKVIAQHFPNEQSRFHNKNSSSYDDRLEEHYHFPRTYLNQVRGAVGDHVIYYEPRRPEVPWIQAEGDGKRILRLRVSQILSRIEHVPTITMRSFLTF